MAIADLQAKLEKLRDARASGTRRIRESMGGSEREVEYRSDAELAAAIADLEKRIAAGLGGDARTIRFQTSKGL